MNKNYSIYLRGLKHASFTVFCVENGQKRYFDPQFGVYVPFSSGQQVKRSIIESITEDLNVKPAPIEFCWDVDKKGKMGEGEVLSQCDPTYIDQLLGGWMRTPKGGGSRALKRRSPLCISAMTPLHPLLAALPKENLSFDRTDRPAVHKVTVRDANGNVLDEDQMSKLLDGTDRSLLRKWIPENTRATGLFVYDVAIDLRRLFCVQASIKEPEVTEETIEALKTRGWTESENVFGKCYVMPRAEREAVIPAIADALIDWRITSNQARTFSLMETLCVAISDNANSQAAAIRAKLTDDGDKQKARPIVDGDAGADVYVALPCANYVVTECESADALEKAKQNLIDRMMNFDYEHQL